MARGGEQVDDPNMYFWLRNGKPLRDLRELHSHLPDMPDDIFSHHVTEFRHDFADWIKYALKDENTAKAARKARTKDSLRKALEPALADSSEHNDKTLDELGTLSKEGKKYEGDEGVDYREQLAERFDEAVKRMQEGLDHELPEELESRAEKLDERARELQAEISEQRKAGYDLFVADLTLRRYRTLLDLAKATEEKKDFDAVDKLFDQVQQEIDEAQKQEQVDVKKEIERLAAE